MAHIIRDNLEEPWGSTWLEFDPGDTEVQAFFKRTRANPFTITRANWQSGTYIPPEVMPRHLKITRGGALRDWRVARGGAQVVSSAFKDCVEALEPGQHQFFPVSIEEAAGGLRLGQWFIFNVVGFIEAIIEERSNLEPLGRKEGLSSWGYQKPAGPWECALDSSVIGTRACWTDLRYARRWFFSDRLVALLQERELGGFDLDEYCEETLRANTENN